MAIIRIPTKTLEAHKQIPNVLQRAFPDLERLPPTSSHELYKTLMTREKSIVPMFEYQNDKLHLKALI